MAGYNSNVDIRDLIEAADDFTPKVNRDARRQRTIEAAMAGMTESTAAEPNRFANNGTTFVLGFPAKEIDQAGVNTLMYHFRSQGLLESEMTKLFIGRDFGVEFDSKAVARNANLLSLLTEAVGAGELYLVSGLIPKAATMSEPPTMLHRRYAGTDDGGNVSADGSQSAPLTEADEKSEKRKDPGNPWHDKDTGKFTSKDSIRSKGSGSYSLKTEGAPQQVRKTKNSVRRQATKLPCGRLNKRAKSTISNRAPFRCWDGKPSPMASMAKAKIPTKKASVSVSAKA